MAGGRPTIYEPGICLRLKEQMSAGKSVVRFCKDENIHPDTFYAWAKKHKEFSDAFAMAKNNCEAFWEEKVIGFMSDKNVNAHLVKFYLANRFGWTDKKEVKEESKTTIVMEETQEVIEARKSYKKDV